MPEIQVTDAQGNIHVFPDGSTPEMIAKAMNVSLAPSSPSVDLTNKQGQGTYQMHDPSGKDVPVPYGQVQTAAREGYSFADDENKFRFAKDSAADPNFKQSYAPVSSDPLATEEGQRQAEQSAPLPIQVAGGIAKGAGTLARPVLDAMALASHTSPQQVDQMLTPNTATQQIAKYGTIAAGLAPALVAAPAATVGGIAAGTAAGYGGQKLGTAIGLTPEQAQILGDATGLAGGIAGGLGSDAIGNRIGNPITVAKNALAGPPESQLTRALQPSKNNATWNADVKPGMQQIKATAQQAGLPLNGFDDASQAARMTLQRIWSQVNQRLRTAGAQGSTIDGNQIADAMMGSIDKRMAMQNPQIVDQIKALADTYRRPIPVQEAEDFIQSNNHELTGYYARNKVSQQAAKSDPIINAKIAEGDAARKALADKIDSLTGPGMSQIKRAYGAVRNIQNQLMTQGQVYARRAPMNLGEQLGYLQAGGKILSGDVLGGVKDIAVRRFISDLNDKNSMIARAFDKTAPAGQFPTPTNPRLAGLLERGARQMPPPSQQNWEPPQNFIGSHGTGMFAPEMSGGERLAALLHYLRNNQPPPALPANVIPRQLPPSF